MIVVCSANAPYLPRVRPYLASLAAHGIPHALACVDCDPPDGVPGYRVNTADLPYAPPLTHLQAGGWQCSPGAPDDDLVIFTDSDIRIQRPLSVYERTWLEQWPQSAIGLGFNQYPGETLAEEAGRIQPTGEPWPQDLAGVACYNTGVIVARRRTWVRLLSATASLWPEVDRAFSHYARQQWAMCAAVARLGLAVVHLPQAFHTHGCYRLPHGCWEDRARLMHLGDVVLFRHHV